MNSFIGWIGGKRALRAQIIERFPNDAQRYIEVFGGAGWVLFGKSRSPGQMEIFNDFDGELINLYRCLKYHPEAVEMEFSMLPHSRELFFDCLAQEKQRGYTDIQRAARSLYLIKVSFGCDRRSFATAPKLCGNIAATFAPVQDRLQRVIIENLDFEHLIKTYDRPDALFYCDPPYVGTEKYYATSFPAEDHRRLADTLHRIKGRFILSYNDNPVVRELYTDCVIEEVSRHNQLSGASRENYAELIIRNYKL